MNVFKVSTWKVKFRLNITLLADVVSHLIHLRLNCRLRLMLCLVKTIVLNQNSIFSEVYPTKHQIQSCLNWDYKTKFLWNVKLGRNKLALSFRTSGYESWAVWAFWANTSEWSSPSTLQSGFILFKIEQSLVVFMNLVFFRFTGTPNTKWNQLSI